MQIQKSLVLVLGLFGVGSGLVHCSLDSLLKADEPSARDRLSTPPRTHEEQWGWIKHHIRDDRLFFDKRELDRDAIRAISAFSDLKELRLTKCGLIDADLIELAKLSNLEMIDLSHNDISDKGGVYLGKLPKLVEAELNFTKIGDRTIEALASRGQMIGLGLRSSQVHGDALACLSRCRQLHALSLQGNIICPQDWPGIQTLTSLRRLNISHTTLLGADLQCLAPLVNLQELRLTQIAGINAESIEIITALPFLTDLAVGHTRLTNQGIQKLTALKHLRFLDISRTDVTDSVLEIIEKTPQWARVDITFCNIGYQSLLESPARKRVVEYGLGAPDEQLDALDAFQKENGKENGKEVRSH